MKGGEEGGGGCGGGTGREGNVASLEDGDTDFGALALGGGGRVGGETDLLHIMFSQKLLSDRNLLLYDLLSRV